MKERFKECREFWEAQDNTGAKEDVLALLDENKAMRVLLEEIRDTPIPKKSLDAVVQIVIMKDRAALALYTPALKQAGDDNEN